MQISFSKSSIESVKSDILVVPLFKKRNFNNLNFLSPALRRDLESEFKREKFKALKKQIFYFSTRKRLPYFGILLIGLGLEKDFKDDLAREIAAIAQAQAQKRHAKAIAFLTDKVERIVKDDARIGQLFAEGFYLSAYQFNEYKSKKKKQTKINKVIICGDKRLKSRDFKQGWSYGAILAQGCNFARDLVNQPPSQIVPSYLAEQARLLAKNPSITLKILNKAQLKKQGFGGILAVAQGSDEEPYLIHLVYRPDKSNKTNKTKGVALAGKGITFDSGGLSLKPSEYMENMKIDMAGAASVLGVFCALTKLKPQIEVHGLIGACENMPGSKAVKPGDIIKSYSGKTIEILNTDAEGRVVLADVLSYAQKLKVNQIIDLATLTGACIRALGDEIAGLLTNSQELAQKLLGASQKSAEKVWQLPLEKKYKSQLKSLNADFKNTHKRSAAGAVIGGLFLQEFVGKIPWAHLDIAGPVWAEYDFSSYMKKGGTGFGVRLLCEYLAKETSNKMQDASNKQ